MSLRTFTTRIPADELARLDTIAAAYAARYGIPRGGRAALIRAALLRALPAFEAELSGAPAQGAGS